MKSLLFFFILSLTLTSMPVSAESLPSLARELNQIFGTTTTITLESEDFKNRANVRLNQKSTFSVVYVNFSSDCDYSIKTKDSFAITFKKNDEVLTSKVTKCEYSGTITADEEFEPEFSDFGDYDDYEEIQISVEYGSCTKKDYKRGEGSDTEYDDSGIVSFYLRDNEVNRAFHKLNEYSRLCLEKDGSD